MVSWPLIIKRFINIGEFAEEAWIAFGRTYQCYFYLRVCLPLHILMWIAHPLTRQWRFGWYVPRIHFFWNPREIKGCRFGCFAYYHFHSDFMDERKVLSWKEYHSGAAKRRNSP